MRAHHVTVSAKRSSCAAPRERGEPHTHCHALPFESTRLSSSLFSSRVPTLFVGYTEGIINICYSTYSVRAAPFYPTTTAWGGTEVHYHPRTRTRTRRISPTDLSSTASASTALNQRISKAADDRLRVFMGKALPDTFLQPSSS